jgi:hypothetical protein
MNNLFVLILMIFCHIVDDYYLQGWLASAKQKQWWKDNAPDKLYRFDYIWALLMHSFSWSFMIMLPIAISQGFEVNWVFGLMLVINLAVHAFVDNLKANVKVINLWVDQSIHMLQIIYTFWLFVGRFL